MHGPPTILLLMLQNFKNSVQVLHTAVTVSERICIGTCLVRPCDIGNALLPQAQRPRRGSEFSSRTAAVRNKWAAAASQQAKLHW